MNPKASGAISGAISGAKVGGPWGAAIGGVLGAAQANDAGQAINNKLFANGRLATPAEQGLTMDSDDMRNAGNFVANLWE